MKTGLFLGWSALMVGLAMVVSEMLGGNALHRAIGFWQLLVAWGEIHPERVVAVFIVVVLAGTYWLNHNNK